MTLVELSHPSISGDQVRLSLLRKGAEAQKEATVEALLKDAVIGMTVPVDILERIIKVVEGTNA